METPSTMGQAVGIGRGVIARQIEKQTAALGGRLVSTASGLRAAADHLQSDGNAFGSGFTGDLAGNLEQFGTYLKDADLDRLMSDADEVVSRAPVAFTTAALFAGVAVARFLRASNRAGYGQNGDGTSDAASSAPAAPRRRRRRKGQNGSSSANGGNS
jgi:hypothetical protein